MFSEVVTQHPWLWTLTWQSAICPAVGLGASFILWRRPVRAHQLLLLAIIAAVLIPALSHVVKHNQWGLFLAKRTVTMHETQPFNAQPDLGTPAVATMSDATVEPAEIVATPSATGASAATGVRWEIAVPLLWLGAAMVLLLRLAVRLFLGWLS
jgi:hypothetical protein